MGNIATGRRMVTSDASGNSSDVSISPANGSRAAAARNSKQNDVAAVPNKKKKCATSARERNHRRLESNERERLRMHSLNSAFEVLFFFFLFFFFSFLIVPSKLYHFLQLTGLIEVSFQLIHSRPICRYRLLKFIRETLRLAFGCVVLHCITSLIPFCIAN